MSATDDELQLLSAQVGQAAMAMGLRLATAESCTGGWIAKCLTDIPGSSSWFDRGFVSYSNRAKAELLGVPAALIDRSGAVSEAVALAMAEGALAHSEARLCVAVTGIAGPGGGTPDKPVGTVWFAWAGADQPSRAQCHQFSGNREAVRRETVATALRGLLRRPATA